MDDVGSLQAELAAKAETRLIFSVGGSIMDLPPEKLPEAAEQMIVMVRMIILGTQTMAEKAQQGELTD